MPIRSLCLYGVIVYKESMSIRNQCQCEINQLTTLKCSLSRGYVWEIGIKDEENARVRFVNEELEGKLEKRFESFRLAF